CLSDASKTTTWLAGYLAYIDPHLLMSSENKLQEINKESDIYSLVMLLWEISSLRPPFEEEDRSTLYIKILNGCREAPIIGTPQQYSVLYTDDPKKRPTIDKVVDELSRSRELTEPMEYEVMKCEGNQFNVNSVKIAVRNMYTVAEVSANYVHFAPLIEIFLKLGEDIVTLYQKAEHNKHLCSYLTQRVNSAVAVIRNLEIRKQDNVEFFREASNLQLVKDFVKCMLDIRKFVADVSQLAIQYLQGINNNAEKLKEHGLDSKNDLELQCQIKVIRSDLAEMKK
ncbi:10562_t:CDS:2, partial [Dentiscutata heterogama]